MMNTTQTTVQTIKIVSLWCKNEEKHNDKLYRLEMTQFGSTWDVFAMYGARGGKMTMHVWANGVGIDAAQTIFDMKLREKFRHGYKVIVEDVLEVGQTRPTVMESGAYMVAA